MNDIILKVERLYAGYGKSIILNDINFSICKGEILAIIGKSGCGKTTLLKNILGLVPYQKGSIKIFDTEVSDRDLVNKRKIQKRMGVLFQRGALLNSLSVGENVGLPLEMYTNKNPDEIRKIVKEKLGMVGLAFSYKKYPRHLSGGMIKRAALARAIAMEPEILLCDEPSAGLDPVTTKNLDKLLLDLKTKFNITVVIVTHDILSIERIADRIIMLDHQKIVYDGSAKDAKVSHVEPLRNFFLLGEDRDIPFKKQEIITKEFEETIYLDRD
ncbi:MAG: ATP-binding cassette domain-containing protein [bacterium]